MALFDIFKVSKYKEEIESLNKQIESLNKQIEESGIKDYCDAQEKISEINSDIDSKQEIISKLSEEIENLTKQSETTDKRLKTQLKKLNRAAELYRGIEYSEQSFHYNQDDVRLLSSEEVSDLDELSPSVILKLHSMDVKDLRKAFRENDKQIEKVLNEYSKRYTTKANQTIYALMVIALKSELQNILYNLKYEKLDISIDHVKEVTSKYLNIAKNGNQNIAGTLTKFIGEIEYLFINAVKIEYNYYVRKEQAKQEQLAIRQQMREEAEERKILEQQHKQIEKEEKKYQSELDKLKETITSAEGEKIDDLNKRIAELEKQLSEVSIKKEEIINLQNGKAGNVYVISNLGSFGEDVFKVGMTRRLEPMDRINELGNASVPFKFDVHSLIFSDDAVSLETKLHHILDEKRVNKVNMRKEFFKLPIDDLEKLVHDIEPTAEFKRTMLAEEYRQSLSSDKNYGETTQYYDIDDEDDE